MWPLIRGLEDLEAIEQIPFSQRCSLRSTYEMIVVGASVNLQGKALSFIPAGASYQTPISITYAQLLGRIHQVANLLHDLGIRPGDTVATLLPNLPHTHFTFWGSEAAGIVCPLNPMLEPGRLRDVLEAVRCRVLFALAPQAGSDIWEKVQTIRKDLPQLKTIVQVMGPGDEKEGILGFDAAVSRYRVDRLDSGRQIAPEEIASYFLTGGTTGRPKLARHTQASEVYMSWAIACVANFSSSDTILSGLPLFHVNGVFVTGGAPFLSGAEVVLLTPRGFRDPAVITNFYKIVEHYHASFFSAVPTVFSTLLKVPIGESKVSSLRFCICGGAPMPVEVFRQFEGRTGIKIIEGYGLTEGTCASLANPRDGERVIGSIGIHLPYQQVKIVAVDAQGQYVRDCQPKEAGIIAVQGPNVFPGYLDPDDNRNIWLAPGLLNTGDLGYCDERGYFYITGRAKDLIIRGGHNIDPSVVEEVLYQIPQVMFAACVGMPDAHAGEVPVAYIQLAAGAQATAESILDYCQQHVQERAAVPKAIYLLENMPLSPIGKVFKPALRFDAIARVYRQELDLLKGILGEIKLQVEETPSRSLLARITVTGSANTTENEIRQKVQDVLGQHFIPYLLTIRPAPTLGITY